MCFIIYYFLLQFSSVTKMRSVFVLAAILAVAFASCPVSNDFWDPTHIRIWLLNPTLLNDCSIFNVLCRLYWEESRWKLSLQNRYAQVWERCMFLLSQSIIHLFNNIDLCHRWSPWVFPQGRCWERCHSPWRLLHCRYFPLDSRERRCRCWESLLWGSSLWRYVLVWILNSIRKNDQLAHFRFILQRYQEGLWDGRNSCCMCVYVHSIFTRRSVLANNLVISLMKTERSLLWPILSLPREITFLYSSVVSFYCFLALLLYDSYLPWYSSWEALRCFLYTIIEMMISS